MQVPKPRPLHPDSLIPSPVPLAHPAQVWPHLFAQRALKQSHHRQEHHACGSALLAGHLLVYFFGSSSSTLVPPGSGTAPKGAGSTALVPAGSGFVPSASLCGCTAERLGLGRRKLRKEGWDLQNIRGINSKLAPSR